MTPSPRPLDDPRTAAALLAEQAHEHAARVLQARHPRAARRQREAAATARARLLRGPVPVPARD